MIANVSVLFTVNGQDKRLDYRKVPFFVWEQLESNHGLTISGLLPAIIDGSVRAVVALLWLERKQRERKLTYDEVRKAIDDDAPPEVVITDVIRDGKSVLTREEEEDEAPSGSGSS